MRVLVVGSGAREHTILKQCQGYGHELFCALDKDNAGIARIAQCEIIPLDGFDRHVAFAKKSDIDLTIVGPEEPLVKGIVARFHSEGLIIFGPRHRPAMVTEGSKFHCKSFLQRHGIKTAEFKLFGNWQVEQAKKYIREREVSCVVKANNLAAGKGVVVARTIQEALTGVDKVSAMEAGELFLIEELLVGKECTFTIVTDGEIVLPLPLSEDYKAAFPGGPNTGGMGARSPVSWVRQDMYDEMLAIMKKAVSGLAQDGRRYKGVLYGGFMITQDGPYILEFNCRFGDPETQVILPLLEIDPAQMCHAVASPNPFPGIEGLRDFGGIPLSSDAVVCVVITSGGYPNNFRMGEEIFGIEEAEAEGASVFHAETKIGERGRLLTNGGRVLSVVGRAPILTEARERAYRAAAHISFGDPDPAKGTQVFREDIASES